MSVTKANLKLARESISKRDYVHAKTCSLKVLDFEPENYNALVFLGMSHLELGEYDESEQIYCKATELNPSQVLAWQGLAQFYERREDWERHAETLSSLLKLFNASQNVVKCAETLQKFVDLRRKHGSSSQLTNALKLYLPESEFYPLLSTLPLPDPTNPTSSPTFEAQQAIHNGFHVLQEILSLTEAQEEEVFNEEVKKRRMRLGAGGPEQIKKDVFLEISSKSQIPALYDAILNHPSTSDELRVDIEMKQLRHNHKHLSAIPPGQEHSAQKRRLLKEVDDLVDTIVLLHKPDELGWKFYFEGRDCEDMSGYDRGQIRDYVRLFPNSALSALFSGYFAYTGESLWPDSDEEETYQVNDVDPVDTVLNASLELPDTILGNRLAADVYLVEQDYENAIKISKLGLRSLKQFEDESGKILQRSRIALQVVLATALVHFFPPKHHKEASRIIKDVLDRSPSNKDAWIAHAFVLEADLQWNAAIQAFDHATNLFGEDSLNGVRALQEIAWCLSQLGQHEKALRSLEHVLGLLDDMDNETTRRDRARCLWRIGKCTVANDSSKTEESYQFFIQALKVDQEFAPAYTSLGMYYLECTSPPDTIRSSKCFQKAFELDAREIEAARRLVEGFANDKEWDLVEVIAQRTIDGEGGLNAGLDKSELDAATKYLPTNAWAWKAIGIVRFNYKDYPAAIEAFQVYLRVDPDDGSLWVRLGEAYAKGGRHAAAVKALNHALELNPDDWVCKYFIAEVKHDMGLFDETISLLHGICDDHPNEAGPFVLLGRTHLDLGLSQLADGLQIRAEQSFLSAVQVALDIIKRMPGFRMTAWKMIGDAAIHLSSFSTFVTGDAICDVLGAIQYLPPPDWAEKVVSIVGLPSFLHGGPLIPLTAATVAIHSYLSQISLSSPKQAGWYDLGVSFQSWIMLAPKSTSPEDMSFIKDKIIEHFKQALQADPGNGIYWTGLGSAYFAAHPKAAQHAYVKALEIDGKNAGTWVNLGLLYFHHGDIELANEAFYRAQVLDPDNTEAWVGQFLVARRNNDKADTTTLLEHAVGLSKPVAEADYEFAFRVFRATEKEERFHRVLDSLLPAFFTLSRYCQRRPNDATGLHLLSLVCERLGHHTRGAELVEQAISILEAAYEETEDPEVERMYTIANCTLGRLRMSLGQPNEAAESFESAQGLLADKESSTDEQIVILKIQVHLGLALSSFFDRNLEAALGYLEEGLQVANDDIPLRSQLIIFLAQILWSIGTEESKETAKSRLLECIASDPENLSAINALAGMGILTEDDGVIDAALSEILAMPMDQKHSLDPQRHVDYLLLQHHLAQKDTRQAASVAQHSLYADPGGREQRNQLASFALRDGWHKEGHALLVGAEENLPFMSNAEDLTGALNLQAVALASQAGSSRQTSGGVASLIRDALHKVQKSILLRPWETRGWQTLAYVRSKMP